MGKAVGKAAPAAAKGVAIAQIVHEGKEGRVVESPVPRVWAVPLPLLNISALREHVGLGLVTVRINGSDEVRVAPSQLIAALD